MSKELNYYGHLYETGLTVTAKVYDKNGAQVGSDVACSEVGTLSIYIGDMPSAPEGVYGVRFFDGTKLLGQGTINWDGAKEIVINDVEVQEIADTTFETFNPPVIDPFENFNLIESRVNKMYIDESLGWIIKLNQNFLDDLKTEFNTTDLPIINTSKVPLTVIVDNTLADGQFAVYGLTP